MRITRPALPTRTAAQLERAAEILDNAKRGDLLAILTPHGQTVRGRVVMRGPAGLVLNTGGRYGTPAIVTPSNLASV